jgi:precorrin-2 dehydrogenase/sirohydrochlorin ferrochelatase
VAARKAAELVGCGAEVVVVAPAVCDEVAAMERTGEVVVARRGFEEGDVCGAMIVVAATDDPRTNVAAREACRAVGVLVNVADVPDLCDFTLPALLRRGRLTVAVSTAGASPALSGRVRDAIAQVIGPEWARCCRACRRTRRRARDSSRK